MEEATRDNFRDLVAEGVTLVDVWGPSCTTCLALMPNVEKLEEERSGEMKVIKLEAPKARRLMMELKLMGLPAFLLFHDGEEISRHDGNVTAESLREWVEGTLSDLTADKS
jgi:thioredoxin-like negative regulator of GroEL